MTPFLLVFESIGTPELVLIVIAALVLFGPRKLPELGRMLGKSLAEFRRASEDFKRTWQMEVELEEAEKRRHTVETASIANTDSAIVENHHSVENNHSIANEHETANQHETILAPAVAPMLVATPADRTVARGSVPQASAAPQQQAATLEDIVHEDAGRDDAGREANHEVQEENARRFVS